MSAFNDYTRYYDLFYKSKDYHHEAEVVNELIIRNMKSGGAWLNLLSVGCGTGKHDREFINLGNYRIHGIDISEDMIEIARREACAGMTYQVADARNFSVKCPFDVAISLFHVMSYQRTNDDIKKAFRSISNALNTGGIFVFDVWYGPGVLRDLPSVRVKSVEDEEKIHMRIAEPEMFPNDNAVDVNYWINIIDKKTQTIKQIKEKHPMRYFFKPELEEYLAQAGFDLLECLGCNTLKEPDFESWTAYFVCRKK